MKKDKDVGVDVDVLDGNAVDMAAAGTYRKVRHTRALQLDKPFVVATKEGTMRGAAGDWLAVGPAGERYPIAAAIFADTYVPAATGAPNGSMLYAGLGYEVQFQHGPTSEKGRNGCAVEDLVRLCMVRLAQLNQGPLACRENALALTHLETAALWLQRRTQLRVSQGVHGTNKPHAALYSVTAEPLGGDR